MMPYPLTRPAKAPILAVLLSPLVEADCHYRKDRGGTVACQGAGCPHCREGYNVSGKFYGPAALVEQKLIERTDAELEARIAAAQKQRDGLLVGLDPMQRAHRMQTPAFERCVDEVSALARLRKPAVESFALIPYPSRDGRFLPRYVVAEVQDTQIGDIENEPGAVIRWEKKGHTRATYAGAFTGELPCVFGWQQTVERLIGRWMGELAGDEGEAPAVLKFKREVG